MVKKSKSFSLSGFFSGLRLNSLFRFFLLILFFIVVLVIRQTIHLGLVAFTTLDALPGLLESLSLLFNAFTSRDAPPGLLESLLV